MPLRSLVAVLALSLCALPNTGLAAENATVPTLEELSSKRAELELKKVEVQLEREKLELKKLRREAIPPAPVFIPTPAMKPKPKPVPRPRIVSVQGVGDALTTTLKTGKGYVTVSVGEKVSGGRIVSIAPGRVVWRIRNASEPLLFME